MKSQLTGILALMVFLGVSAVSAADVRYSVSIGNDSRDVRREWAHPYYAPYYYTPRRRHVRPVYYYPSVVVAPPVYVAPSPEVQSPVASLSGNYGADLASLHEKMYRLRGVLQHQSQTGQITPDEYARFTETIEGVEHDEHARAYDRGGNLAAEDFYDLDRRLDQVNADIQVALAQ